jgi:hypothetical protein
MKVNRKITRSDGENHDPVKEATMWVYYEKPDKEMDPHEAYSEDLSLMDYSSEVAPENKD